jgi:MoxR-like ATPase
MPSSLESVSEALREGKRLIAVQSEQFAPFRVAYAESDPAGVDRAVFAWDSEDGFQPVRDVMDLPPACLEPIEALEFIEGYQGTGLFLLDGTDGVFSDAAEAVRPRLKKLLSKTAVVQDLAVVLVVASPLPESLARNVTWLGDEPPVAESKEPAAKAPRKSQEWKEIQSLREFDAEKWQNRIDVLSAEEVEEIIGGGYHRDALERVNELRSQMKQHFAQKDEIIDAITACAVAQVPCVLMGPPGTAKGHLIRTFCEGLGLTDYTGRSEDGKEPIRKYFEYQLTRFTTPEELFGPVHVQDLIERQTYRRVTEGYLPTAHVAFLDELFKGSSAILNTMLSILNERVFYNEGRPERVPLTTIFAASNEPPQEETLGALYDRFPIRVNCPSVEDDLVADLHGRAWEDSFDRHFSQNRQAQQQVACANDLRLLKKVSFVMLGGRNLKLSQELGGGGFEQEFLKVFKMMRREAGISDRSLAMLYAYARANALLAGRKSFTADDLEVFRHVVWGREDEFGGFFRQLKKGYRVG